MQAGCTFGPMRRVGRVLFQCHDPAGCKVYMHVSLVAFEVPSRRVVKLGAESSCKGLESAVSG